jgi:CxxC motif-containing protein (DUF1111 family)
MPSQRTLTKQTATLVVGLLVVAGMSCEGLLPSAIPENQILDGPVQGLSNDESLRFLRGDDAFNNGIFTKENGLGPLFVATSCAACHPGDGKGHPFTTLTRFGQIDASGNQYTHVGGPQLQHRAIPGFTPEVIPAGATFSRFTPPANTGLGFLDAVSDADILSMSDPTDADGDGISGTPNWVAMKGYLHPRQATVEVNGKYIGRFGKKAATYDLLQQTATAYNQDIGITSEYEYSDPYSGATTDPEISSQTIEDVVFYLKTLKAPIPRSFPEEATAKALFANAGCDKCHRPQWTTGHSPIAAISNKTFYPYTDLLLHDMGQGLDDGYTEGSALTSEWKTPALWGLGLSKNSQGGNYYLLHDGRARSIEDAILMHGGEATQSREKYKSFSAPDKRSLITFLESL